VKLFGEMNRRERANGRCFIGKLKFWPGFYKHINSGFSTNIRAEVWVGTDLIKIRLDPINPRHPRSNTTYRTRIQRITRIETDLTKIRLDPPNPRHPRSNTTYRTRIQRIARIGTDLTKIRLDPINPRHPRSNTTYRTRIQRIARIGTDLLKIWYAVVGTADEDTRHEAIAFAPACVGLVIRTLDWHRVFAYPTIRKTSHNGGLPISKKTPISP
jgi:hypothetical protein